MLISVSGGQILKPFLISVYANQVQTCASSSENSLMLDSDDELTAADCSDCRSASSLAYFFTYSDTFFLYSSGLEGARSKSDRQP